ncbi:uncharacterized protein H6S33_011023 [Morchella sextelata]|jgi:hypothetical protein|uniref:uncharacterized protein n=1 Tax=Morchella sextelata TaxID=1174677 RepID=UPI001D05786B|nr:uncharacterized protein H6S33_011023 [Morchella sextelata]KAH0611758.1 hypothetical protein H6S33_011023 [Morchella sextelata]
MHRLLELPILHMKIHLLRRRLKRCQKEIDRLDGTINLYKNLRLIGRPNIVVEEAMHEKRVEILFKMRDMNEDVNILESRIMTLKSERERKKGR